MTQILLKLSPYQLVIPISLISSLQQIRLLCNELVSFRISDHAIVHIQVNTSAKILFQKPRSISKKANWDGMKQALEIYHEDMLESGKYSSINAVPVQLWDDLLLSQTNSSLQNSLAPEIISLGSTKNSNGLLNKETELFRSIGNQVNLLIEKSF